MIMKKYENLTSRERVKLALNHQEPDKVPFALGGTAQKLPNKVVEHLLQMYQITDKPQMVMAGYNKMLYSIPLMKKLDVDIAYLYLNASTGFSKYDGLENKNIDEWGLTRERLDGFTNLGGSPLGEAEIDDLKKYSWPDPYDTDRVKGLSERAEYMYNETDFALAAHRPTQLGIFEMASLLRGTEKFYMDFILDKKFIHALLDKLLEINLGFYEVLINAVGKYVEIYEMEDDLASQFSLLISPDMYREFVKPRHRELVNFIKKRIPEAKIMYHSCGAINSLIPDLIDIGIDILNPLQPLAEGMKSRRIKNEYGKDLVFQGGLDVQEALRGDEICVKRELKQRLRDFAPGGGYIAGPSHNFGADIPLNTIISIPKLIREYGKYPINI
jgi:uroporphyrinogen decarboxylase